MKKPDITQPVIDKCKQIAEYWRMEIYEGSWILEAWHGMALVKWSPYLVSDISLMPHRKNERIPIPSISDCLEKLRELNDIHFTIDSDARGWAVAIVHPFHPKFNAEIHDFEGDTLHEALLSALLAVLKK